MADDVPFRELLARVRQGDQAAANEIVRQYEPLVRAAARQPLDALSLRRIMDSADISQAVLANFFLSMADGAFNLQDEDQLVKLLITMARNRVRDEARRERAERRGGGGVADESDHCLAGLQADEPTPSSIVSDRELSELVYSKLPAEIRLLAEARVAGVEWTQLATQHNSTPQALRKKMARAMEKLARDLAVDET
jgi:RNA polymerase sigma factor (sigma-70 family)